MNTRFIVKLAVFVVLCVMLIGAVLITYSIENKPPSYPIDINAASVEELLFLEGMTPSVASRIVAYRESFILFTSVEDLLYVDGITLENIEQWRPYIAL